MFRAYCIGIKVMPCVLKVHYPALDHCTDIKHPSFITKCGKILLFRFQFQFEFELSFIHLGYVNLNFDKKIIIIIIKLL